MPVPGLGRTVGFDPDTGQHGHVQVAADGAGVCNAVFQALFTGTIPSILAEMFSTRVRYTALSVSYGLAVVLFGGFAPLISTWLVDQTGNPFAPAFYVMTGGALSAIAILSMKEFRNAPLE
jgi:MHS family proline/betaine transporter-like MFS transporter